MIEILVAGDIAPVGRALAPLTSGDTAALFNDLAPKLQSADLLIGNLECPLTRRLTPIRKAGPALSAPEASLTGLAAAGFHALGLANNHMLDHGPSALESTMRACHEYGIATVGAGANRDEAAGVLYRSVNDFPIGILAVTEKCFSTATDAPALNGLDIPRLVKSVRAARRRVGYLLVLLHGGIEHFPFPSPALQELCRFLVEEGASCVICQHSHCAGAIEPYRGRHIVYGQGNFVFDGYPYHPGSFYSGFLVQLSLSSDGTAELRPIPYRQFDHVPSARLLHGSEKAEFLGALEQRSLLVRSPELVQREFDRYCQDNEASYLSHIRGHSRGTRLLHRFCNALWRLQPAHRFLLPLAVMQNESLREVAERILALRLSRSRSRDYPVSTNGESWPGLVETFPVSSREASAGVCMVRPMSMNAGRREE